MPKTKPLPGGVPPRKAASAPEQPDRRVRRSEARRVAILDAALALFSRHGLHGTSVDQIAELADVSKTNLFYYFASKEEIYASVLRRLLEAWLAPLRTIEIETDPVEAIRSYIREKIAFSRHQPEASRLFCLEMIQGAPIMGEELRTTLKALVDAKAGIIRAWSEAGKIAPVDPHHLIFAIWSITQHYADFGIQVEALVGRTLRDEDYFEDTVRHVQGLILDGIRAVRGAASGSGV